MRLKKSFTTIGKTSASYLVLSSLILLCQISCSKITSSKKASSGNSEDLPLPENKAEQPIFPKKKTLDELVEDNVCADLETCQRYLDGLNQDSDAENSSYDYKFTVVPDDDNYVVGFQLLEPSQHRMNYVFTEGHGWEIVKTDVPTTLQMSSGFNHVRISGYSFSPRVVYKFALDGPRGSKIWVGGTPGKWSLRNKVDLVCANQDSERDSNGWYLISRDCPEIIVPAEPSESH